MDNKRPLESMPDDELLRRLVELLHQSRRVESDLVAHIAEVDERKLYAREASPSMFAYCTDVLHLSGAEAYLRIAAARASREHPILLTMLADGRLHLTAIGLLAPHLTAENRDALLGRATHQCKREIEEMIAELVPRPDAPAVMRKLPEARALALPALAIAPSPVSALSPVSAPELRADRDVAPVLELRPDGVASSVTSSAAPKIEPVAPGCYKVQFTARTEFRDKLERLRALMRSTVPDGDLAALLEVAVTEKLERLEARRFGRAKTPRKELAETDVSFSSRYIPAAVRRAVSKRDGDQCHYVDRRGRRCPERGGLEFHHRHPHGLGGDRGPQNICLMCRTHNAYLAEQDYGRKAILRHRRSGKSLRGPDGVRSLADPTPPESAPD